MRDLQAIHEFLLSAKDRVGDFSKNVKVVLNANWIALEVKSKGRIVRKRFKFELLTWCKISIYELEEHLFWEVLPQLMSFGTCCLILSCSLWEVQSTYQLSQWQRHKNSRFMGHTSQSLQDRIKQHVPKSILVETETALILFE